MADCLRLSTGIPEWMDVMQAAEAAVAQVHAEERSHCRQVLAEAKTGAAVRTGAIVWLATV